MLIGTQMIVKGHDFPEGDIGRDPGGRSVLKRIGLPCRRADISAADPGGGQSRQRVLPGEAVIRLISRIIMPLPARRPRDYKSFYEEEILYRELSGYPPAAHMLAVQIYGKEEENVKTACPEADRCGKV